MTLFGAGRTDSGVHALGQVAHFDLEGENGADTVRDALNFHLKPHAVSVLEAELTDNDFDARLAARERVYLYRITNRRAPLGLNRGLSWWVPAPLDARARSFLHHQVRNLVGTLKLVGEGKWTAGDVKAALDKKDRAAGGPTAPPDGLYLVEVVY